MVYYFIALFFHLLLLGFRFVGQHAEAEKDYRGPVVSQFFDTLIQKVLAKVKVKCEDIAHKISSLLESKSVTCHLLAN